LANNLTWAEQVKIGEVQSSSLSYASLKEEMKDTVSIELTVKPTHVSYITEMNNTSALQGLEPSCYDSKLKVLSNETTLVLSNTRELDKVPSTK